MGRRCWATKGMDPGREHICTASLQWIQEGTVRRYTKRKPAICRHHANGLLLVDDMLGVDFAVSEITNPVSRFN